LLPAFLILPSSLAIAQIPDPCARGCGFIDRQVSPREREQRASPSEREEPEAPPPRHDPEAEKRRRIYEQKTRNYELTREGNDAFRRGEFVSAINSYENALKYWNDPITRANLALAKDALAKAKAADASDEAYAAFLRGEYDRAATLYEKALNYWNDPTTKDNLAKAKSNGAFELGRAFMGSENWDAAIAQWKNANDLCPKSCATSYRNRLLMYINWGHGHQQLRLANAASSKQDWSTAVTQLLLAAKYFDHALELAPDNASIKFWIEEVGRETATAAANARMTSRAGDLTAELRPLEPNSRLGPAPDGLVPLSPLSTSSQDTAWIDIPDTLKSKEWVEKKRAEQWAHLSARAKELNTLDTALKKAEKQQIQSADSLESITELRHEMAVDSLSDLLAAIPMEELLKGMVDKKWITPADADYQMMMFKRVRGILDATIAENASNDRQRFDNLLSAADDLRGAAPVSTEIPKPERNAVDLLFQISFAVASVINSEREGKAPRHQFLDQPEWYENPDALTKAYGFLDPGIGAAYAFIDWVGIKFISSRIEENEKSLREALDPKISVDRLRTLVQKKEAETDAELRRFRSPVQ
jgi:tetratricopeptide (TPR) repeat protein